MRKRKALIGIEVFLIVSMTFAVSFILNSATVSADLVPVHTVTHLTSQGEFISSTTTYTTGPAVTSAAPATPAVAPAAAPAAAPAVAPAATPAALPAAPAGLTTQIAGTLLQGLAYAGIAYLAGSLIGNALGLQKGETDALATALAVGAGVYGVLTGPMFSAGGVLGTGAGSFGSTLGVAGTTTAATAAAPAGAVVQPGLLGLSTGPLVIGLVIAVIIFVMLYKKEKVQTVTFECAPWEAPIRGENCEKCNDNPLQPCSEYRCKSLGQACEIINPGTDEEKCVWINPKDVEAPKITPSQESLKPLGLQYTNHDTLPPSRGAKIIDPSNTGGCLKSYTPLVFGLKLDEPGACKIDYNHTSKFEDMQFNFGGSVYLRYNHTNSMRLPAPDNGSFDGLVIKNNGRTDLFVRCQDANGNSNEAEFAVSFCVDKSPDTTPPLIEGSSIPSGSYVRAKASNVTIEIYVNEPVECRWSLNSNKIYEDMESSAPCETTPRAINANLRWVCSSVLTGVKDRVENKYYFKCKDTAGNEMVESKEIVLKGTDPLNILKVGPNATVSGSTSEVGVELYVETDDGAEDGTAVCAISPTGFVGTYTEMYTTRSYLHKQTLNLPAGEYIYYFGCADAGGNVANATVLFRIFVDTIAPIVTRVYKQEGPIALKIVTNEEANCVYSYDNCNYEFEKGFKMINNPPAVKTIHFSEWKTNSVYYIKCEDRYGNRPNPNECSLVASASQLE